ncbi:MAG: DUF5995 family protein [Jatrophihabitantaceae bacterium]
MGSMVPAPEAPAASIDDVIARMQSIDGAMPAGDGVACFNRMYLEVTLGVNQRIQQGAFTDSAFVSRLDVVFANLYFSAVDALSGPPSAVPVAWAPLLNARARAGIEPVQFALAGMNAHINHDLPVAVVRTCVDLATAPTDGPHHDDYQQIDTLLDAAEQSVRESFEPSGMAVVDQHVAAVANVIGNWSISTARDVAWDTALALWEVRGHQFATELLTGTLARTVAMASRCLLVVG